MVLYRHGLLNLGMKTTSLHRHFKVPMQRENKTLFNWDQLKVRDLTALNYCLVFQKGAGDSALGTSGAPPWGWVGSADTELPSPHPYDCTVTEQRTEARLGANLKRCSFRFPF